MASITLNATDLVLGDKVDLLGGDPYGWGTVVQITAEEVHIFRPYVHIGDFSYTGGVQHYIGTELVKVYKFSTRTFEADASTHKQMTAPGALR